MPRTFLSDDADFARETAQQLDTFNRERQDIERKITEEAERMIEERYISDSGIVLFSEAWHPGVVGIVAGRVTRRYNRPCIVLGNEGDMAKGSGRSVDGMDLVDILGTCPEGLTSWGGIPWRWGSRSRSPRSRVFARGSRRPCAAARARASRRRGSTFRRGSCRTRSRMG